MRQRFDVESRAPHNNRHAPARCDFSDHWQRHLAITLRVTTLLRGQHIVEMMRHTRPVCPCRFGRQQRQPLIKLERVRIHDLSADPFSQRKCDG